MEHFQALQICKDLHQLVARAFYDDRELMVIDILQLNDSFRDDQLASALGVNIKELQKICGKLKLGGMIQTTARWEELGKTDIQVRREFKERRKINRTYYYIDYARAINVIKLKIFKIGKMIDKEVHQNVTETHLYKCPRCSKGFSALEMLTLERTEEQYPICDVCLAQVELNEQRDTHSSNAKYVKFMNETKPIISLLKQTDSLVIPESDPRLPDLSTTTADGKEIVTVPEQVPLVPTSNIFVEIEQQKEEEETKNGTVSADIDLQDYYASLIQNGTPVSESIQSTPIIPQYLYLTIENDWRKTMVIVVKKMKNSNKYRNQYSFSFLELVSYSFR
jgi:transcription initiation factor IIE alpha subunit